MPDSWVSVGFVGVVWLASAIASVTGIATEFGLIGLVFWGIFLLGILYVVAQFFGYDHL